MIGSALDQDVACFEGGNDVDLVGKISEALSRDNARTQNAATSALLSSIREISGFGRMCGGGRSHCRTRLCIQFPANREKNREIGCSAPLKHPYPGLRPMESSFAAETPRKRTGNLFAANREFRDANREFSMSALGRQNGTLVRAQAMSVSGLHRNLMASVFVIV